MRWERVAILKGLARTLLGLKIAVVDKVTLFRHMAVRVRRLFL
jgi:hypothetical protein